MMDDDLFEIQTSGFGSYLPESDQGIGDRAAKCRQDWDDLDQRVQGILKRTVQSELRRLADNIDVWLPDHVETVNGTFEIQFRVFPNVRYDRLSPTRDKVNKAMQALDRMVEDGQD